MRCCSTSKYAPLDEDCALPGSVGQRAGLLRRGEANIETPRVEHTRLAIDQNRGALGVFGQTIERTIAESKLTAAERAVFTRVCRPHGRPSRATLRCLEKLDGELAEGVRRAPSASASELYDAEI